MRLPYPEAEFNQYNIVHALLLKYAFKVSEWLSVIRNLTTLLAPDGYLYWEYTNYDNWTCIPATLARIRISSSPTSELHWQQDGTCCSSIG